MIVRTGMDYADFVKRTDSGDISEPPSGAGESIRD